MPNMTALNDNDPRMIAWNKYKESPEYQNTRMWALNPHHVDGSLWAAWLQGYEIGKSGVEMGKVNRVDECECGHPISAHSSVMCLARGCKCQKSYRELAGSAETGGEKAARSKFEMACAYCEHFHYLRNPCPVVYGIEAIPCGCKFFVEQASPNFLRSSQNQTAASGVEGAHEGTTADKKVESREPEKLNNAQKSEVEVDPQDTGFPDYKPLAESSLSSTPPKEKL